MRKDFSCVKVAQQIEEILGRRLRGELRGETARKCLGFEIGGEPVRIDRRIENMRAADHHFGEPRRAAENIGEKIAQLRIGFENGQKFGDGLHPAERGIEGDERGIRIARLREGLQQGRHKFGQNFARAFGLHRGVAAEMPAADRLGRQCRPLEAEFRQRLQGFRIVADAGEDEIADLGRKARRALEEARIMFGDLGRDAQRRLRQMPRASHSRKNARSAQEPRRPSADAASVRRRSFAADARSRAERDRRR